MKVKSMLAVAVSALLMIACNNNPKGSSATESGAATIAIVDGHNAENSLDYVGTYVGVLPAADCPGIEITLTLNKDKSFTQVSKYIDRDSFNYHGTYSLSGNVLTAVNTENDSTFYKVEENRIRFLDREKQPITGQFADMYILSKK